MTYSFCPHSVALEFTQKFVGKLWPATGADKSAILLVRNVKEGLQVQNFISPLSLRDFLGENFLKYSNHNDRITQWCFSAYLASIVLNTQMSENISNEIRRT